jgi:hypothetical protein
MKVAFYISSSIFETLFKREPGCFIEKLNRCVVEISEVPFESWVREPHYRMLF